MLCARGGKEEEWQMTEEKRRENHIWIWGAGGGEWPGGGQWGEKDSRDNLTPFIGTLEAIWSG